MNEGAIQIPRPNLLQCSILIRQVSLSNLNRWLYSASSDTELEGKETNRVCNAISFACFKNWTGNNGCSVVMVCRLNESRQSAIGQ